MTRRPNADHASDSGRPIEVALRSCSLRYPFGVGLILGLTCACDGERLNLGDSDPTGIEAPPCEPGCQDGTTRVFCDPDGKRQVEPCPVSSEECAAPACEAGACTLKPTPGAACGESGTARCNEGSACLGASIFLSARLQQTCLVAEDGRVWCWGTNTHGQLGDGTTTDGLNPVLVRGLPDRAVLVSLGYAHTCALLRNGRIYCWGNNQAGQCGVVPSMTILEPVPVSVPNVVFTSVAAGQGHTCAISTDKTVYCWGNTTHGQCGFEPVGASSVSVGPTKVPGLDSVESIVTVKNHTCAVRSIAPTMVCWGSNTHVEEASVDYKLGPAAGDLAYSAIPVPVELGAPVVGAGMGYESTYAVTADGRVHAWGRNNRGQLGIESGPSPTPTSTPAPVMIETLAGLVPLTGVLSLVSSDGSDQCVIMQDRLAFGAPYLCWGGDDWGELGAGTEAGARTLHPFPIPVRALPATAGWLARGEDHACAAVFVGGGTEIWCYGRPGVLGNGSYRAPDTAPPTQWQGTPVVW
jgi:hypothetical protein